MPVRKPTKTELEYINENLANSTLEADDIYVLDTNAANDYNLTVYFYRLDTSSLRNFARDVKNTDDPIAMLVNHGGGFFGDPGMPLGTWFAGTVNRSNSNNNKEHEFKASVYMAKSLSANGYTTDDLVKAYEAGHLNDVSISWQGGKTICDLCENDIRSSDCEHYPGQTYDGELCTFTVKGAQLRSEISLVWKGGLPGAKILGQEEGDDNCFLGQFKNSQEIQKATIENIKDIPVGAILSHTLSYRGHVLRDDKLLEEEGDSGDDNNPTIIVEDNDMKIEDLKKDHGDLINEHYVEKSVHDEKVTELTDENIVLVDDNKKLEENLTKSEGDKADLQQKLDDSDDSVKIAGDHIDSLKKRHKELGADVHGDKWDEDKEEGQLQDKSGQALVDYLSNEITKLEALQKEVRGKIDPGKKTLSGDDKGDEEYDHEDNDSLYKM